MVTKSDLDLMLSEYFEYASQYGYSTEPDVQEKLYSKAMEIRQKILDSAILTGVRGGDDDPDQYVPYDEADDMCPNCVTPWKCNGPHLYEETSGYLRRK